VTELNVPLKILHNSNKNLLLQLTNNNRSEISQMSEISLDASL